MCELFSYKGNIVSNSCSTVVLHRVVLFSGVKQKRGRQKGSGSLFPPWCICYRQKVCAPLFIWVFFFFFKSQSLPLLICSLLFLELMFPKRKVCPSFLYLKFFMSCLLLLGYGSEVIALLRTLPRSGLCIPLCSHLLACLVLCPQSNGSALSLSTTAYCHLPLQVALCLPPGPTASTATTLTGSLANSLSLLVSPSCLPCPLQGVDEMLSCASVAPRAYPCIAQSLFLKWKFPEVKGCVAFFVLIQCLFHSFI